MTHSTRKEHSPGTRRTPGSASRLPMIAARDRPNRDLMTLSPAGRFKSVQPNAHHGGHAGGSRFLPYQTLSGVKARDRQNLTVRWDQDDQLYDQELIRQRKLAFLENQQQKMKIRIQKDQKTTVQKNGQQEQQRIASLGRTFQERTRIQEYTQMCRDIIDKSKRKDGSRNRGAGAEESEEELVGDLADGNREKVKINIGEVGKLIARTLEQEQKKNQLDRPMEEVVLEDGPGSLFGEPSSGLGEKAAPLLTKNTGQSYRQSKTSKNTTSKKSGKQPSSNHSKMVRTSQQFVKIRDDTGSKRTVQQSSTSGPKAASSHQQPNQQKQ